LVNCDGKLALAVVYSAFVELDPFRSPESVGVKCAIDGEEAVIEFRREFGTEMY